MYRATCTNIQSTIPSSKRRKRTIQRPRRKIRNKKVLKGLRMLHSFCTAGLHSLGFKIINNPFERKGYQHGVLLGNGMLANVYAVYGRDNLIIKIYCKPGEAQMEADVLKELQEWRVTNVPQLVKGDKRALILSPVASNLQQGQFSKEHAIAVLKTLRLVHEKATSIGTFDQPIC